MKIRIEKSDIKGVKSVLTKPDQLGLRSIKRKEILAYEKFKKTQDEETSYNERNKWQAASKET
jgi:hypothetical protein